MMPKTIKKYMVLCGTATMLISAVASATANTDTSAWSPAPSGRPAAEEQAPVALQIDEVVVEVHGVVCSFCSKGVQNKIARLEFVDTSRHLQGSLVEIEKQRVIIAIKPGASFNAPAVFKAIRDGGYDPVVAYVRQSDGTVVKQWPEGH